MRVACVGAHRHCPSPAKMHCNFAKALKQAAPRPRAGTRGRDCKPTLAAVTSQSGVDADMHGRSEEHTSELQSLMRISYAVFCLKKKNIKEENNNQRNNARCK